MKKVVQVIDNHALVDLCKTEYINLDMQMRWPRNGIKVKDLGHLEVGIWVTWPIYLEMSIVSDPRTFPIPDLVFFSGSPALDFSGSPDLDPDLDI